MAVHQVLADERRRDAMPATDLEHAIARLDVDLFNNLSQTLAHEAAFRRELRNDGLCPNLAARTACPLERVARYELNKQVAHCSNTTALRYKPNGYKCNDTHVLRCTKKAANESMAPTNIKIEAQLWRCAVLLFASLDATKNIPAAISSNAAVRGDLVGLRESCIVLT